MIVHDILATANSLRHRGEQNTHGNNSTIMRTVTNESLCWYHSALAWGTENGGLGLLEKLALQAL